MGCCESRSQLIKMQRSADFPLHRKCSATNQSSLFKVQNPQKNSQAYVSIMNQKSTSRIEFNQRTAAASHHPLSRSASSYSSQNQDIDGLIDDLFDQFDKFKKGFLDMEDFKLLLIKTTGRNFTAKEAGALLKMAHTHSDKVIDKNELRELYKAMVAGRITY